MRKALVTTTSSVVVLLCFLLFAIVVVVADTRRHVRDEVTGHIPSTHEEILSTRQQHKELFSERLAEMKKKFEDHINGTKLLTRAEYQKIERKIKAYESKVEDLSREFDERHLNRVLAREEILNEMTRSRFARREEL
jgi:peptidoglycan hydrolase CwlO-like protein